MTGRTAMKAILQTAAGFVLIAAGLIAAMGTRGSARVTEGCEGTSCSPQASLDRSLEPACEARQPVHHRKDNRSERDLTQAQL